MGLNRDPQKGLETESQVAGLPRSGRQRGKGQFGISVLFPLLKKCNFKTEHDSPRSQECLVKIPKQMLTGCCYKNTVKHTTRNIIQHAVRVRENVPLVHF